MIKKIIERVDEHRPSEVHSAFLKKFFHSLTSAFLIPLERYMISLIPDADLVTPFKSLPQITPFNQDDFFKSLADGVSSASSNYSSNTNKSNVLKAGSFDTSSNTFDTSPKSIKSMSSSIKSLHPASISGIKGDWICLYKKFFRTSNFKKFFDCKFQELESQLKQLHIKSIFEADLLDWIKDKSEVEVIDLILILKKKIQDMERDVNYCTNYDHEKKKNDDYFNCDEIKNESEAIKRANHEQVIKLNKLLIDIINVLPPDLHPILNK